MAAAGAMATSGASGATGASGPKITYESIFHEGEYPNVPHDASILGPGAYFADLMHAVERSVRGCNDGPYGLAARRPDLANLLLTADNATRELSNADLILEILESTLNGFSVTPAARILPAYPVGAPDVVKTISGFPDSFDNGKTYVVDAFAPISILKATSIDCSVTICSARGMQMVSIDAIPIVVCASSGQVIVIEGLSFTSRPQSPPRAPILKFGGGILVLRNCVFTATDSALQNGWAIQTVATSDGKPATGAIVLEHCTFAEAGPASSPHRAIDCGNSGSLTVVIRSCIIWSKNAPADSELVAGGPGVAMSFECCNISGGKGSIDPGGSPLSSVRYGSTNFDQDPKFRDPEADTWQIRFLRLDPTSPCIGRSTDGSSVGASYDIYDALRWAVYPLDFPFDVSVESARLALRALAIELEDVDIACSAALPDSPNLYFRLSQLGLTIPDYLTLSNPLTNGLEPYFGLPKTFQDASIVIAPSYRAA